MKVIGVISARYNSTRFPGKLLATVLGTPIIQYTWENAKKAKSLNDLIVACDDERIFKTIQSFDGKAIMTSSKPKNGTERAYEATKDKEVDIIVNIQGDEPLVHYSMIDKMVGVLQDNPFIFVSSVMKHLNISNNLYNIFDKSLVKVVVNKNKEALYFSRQPIPNQNDYYQHIGLYAYKQDFLKLYNNLEESKLEKLEQLEQLRFLENNCPIKMVETEYTTIGINEPKDLKLVEYLLKEREKNG